MTPATFMVCSASWMAAGRAGGARRGAWRRVVVQPTRMECARRKSGLGASCTAHTRVTLHQERVRIRCQRSGGILRCALASKIWYPTFRSRARSLDSHGGRRGRAGAWDSPCSIIIKGRRRLHSTAVTSADSAGRRARASSRGPRPPGSATKVYMAHSTRARAAGGRDDGSPLLQLASGGSVQLSVLSQGFLTSQSGQALSDCHYG
jgi:hypothetical protein